MRKSFWANERGSGDSTATLSLYDNGGRDVALRFDLTVPFALRRSAHRQLGTPFKRYHMGPVVRRNAAGRPVPRVLAMRLRHIGTESNAADAEAALVIHDLMRALGFERFEVRVNNRLALNGLLEELGLAEQAGRAARAGQAAENRPRRCDRGDDGKSRGEAPRRRSGCWRWPT